VNKLITHHFDSANACFEHSSESTLADDVFFGEVIGDSLDGVESIIAYD